MGKGDKRTRRGKIFNRSYGKSRPQNKVGAVKGKATTSKKKAN